MYVYMQQISRTHATGKHMFSVPSCSVHTTASGNRISNHISNDRMIIMITQSTITLDSSIVSLLRQSQVDTVPTTERTLMCMTSYVALSLYGIRFALSNG